MKKIVIVLLVFFFFSWISVVSAGNFPAKESPESTVHCVLPIIDWHSVLGTINVEKCDRYTPEDTCSPCITSLEEQGCKFIDVVVGHTTYPQESVKILYLLSCDGR